MTTATNPATNPRPGVAGSSYAIRTGHCSPLADQRCAAPHRHRALLPHAASSSASTATTPSASPASQAGRASSISPRPSSSSRSRSTASPSRSSSSVAIACRLVALFAEPYLSSDIYRYVWDGIVQHAHISPYRYVPGDPALAFLRAPHQDIFDNINRRDYAHTIYPPAAQALFYLITWISPTVTFMKTVMVLFEGVTMYALITLLHIPWASAASRPSSTPGVPSSSGRSPAPATSTPSPWPSLRSPCSRAIASNRS